VEAPAFHSDKVPHFAHLVEVVDTVELYAIDEETITMLESEHGAESMEAVEVVYSHRNSLVLE